MFGTGVKLNRVLKSTPSSRRETAMLIIHDSTGVLKSTPSSRRETTSVYLQAQAIELKSTPSSRRETSTSRNIAHLQRSLNPLPPRGGRH